MKTLKALYLICKDYYIKSKWNRILRKEPSIIYALLKMKNKSIYDNKLFYLQCIINILATTEGAYEITINRMWRDFNVENKLKPIWLMSTVEVLKTFEDFEQYVYSFTRKKICQEN